MYRQLQLLVVTQQNTYTGTAFNLSKGKANLKRSFCVCVCVFFFFFLQFSFRSNVDSCNPYFYFLELGTAARN